MTFELFTPLFALIDELSLRFVTQICSRMVTRLTPVISVGMTFSFILYSMLIIQGLVVMPIQQFLIRSLRIALIMSIAGTGGFYQSHLAQLICQLPDEVMRLLLDHPADQGAAHIIDQAGQQGLQCVSEAFSKAGLFKDHGIVYALIAAIILVNTVTMLSIGGAYILMSKLALALLAGIGPLFIMLLAFTTTRRLFHLWLSQASHYLLLLFLYAVVFGLLMDMFSNFMTDLSLDGIQHVGNSLGGVSSLTTTMIIIIRQLPKLTQLLVRQLRFDSGNDNGSGIAPRLQGSGPAAPSTRAIPYQPSPPGPASWPDPAPALPPRGVAPIYLNYYQGSAR